MEQVVCQILLPVVPIKVLKPLAVILREVLEPKFVGTLQLLPLLAIVKIKNVVMPQQVPTLMPIVEPFYKVV